MKKHKFSRKSQDSLIVVPCFISENAISLALDTGASHTTIDLSALIVADYELKDAVGTVQIEAASGVIEGKIFILKEFSCLGITKQDVQVAAYDFLAHHLLTDFDGVLGLDFFEGVKFCIDMNKSIITIQ